jgi:hypothetical protein
VATKTLTPSLLIASSTAFLFAAPASAAGGFPLQCASRDLQAFLRIEQHGEARDIDGAVVGKAFVTLLEARQICGNQRVDEAIAIYDGILPPSLTTATK